MKAITIILILCSMMLIGCGRYYCDKHYPPIATEKTNEIATRDTTVPLPGANITVTIPARPAIKTTPPFMLPSPGPSSSKEGGQAMDKSMTRPNILTDTTGRAQLTWWYDAADNLHIDCACKEIPYTIKGAIKEHKQATIQTITINQHGFFWYSGVLAWCLIILFIGWHVIKFIRQLKPI